jgi:hypothetical protein
MMRTTLTAALFFIVVLGIVWPLGAQPGVQQTGTYQLDRMTLPEAGRPVSVEVIFQLLTIHEIDDEAETFRISGLLTLTWKDPRQAFDPQSEGVTEKIFQGGYQFNELSPGWYPQVILINATGMDETQGVVLRVKPDGTSSLIQTITTEARSKLDLRRYPFDRQRLEVVFETLGFDASEVILEAGKATVRPGMIQVPQWEFKGIRLDPRANAEPPPEPGPHSSALVLNLEVERCSFFMARLVLVPLILIVALSFSVFWMDRSSLGDRMAVSFVGILTAVSYQTMVSDIMPRISYITLMNSILNFSFFVMCATVVINLIVGALDKRGEEKKGERLDLCCRWVFPLAYAGLLAISSAVFFVFY